MSCFRLVGCAVFTLTNHTHITGEIRGFRSKSLIEGFLPKGPYLSCVSMAGRALLAGYHRYAVGFLGKYSKLISQLHIILTQCATMTSYGITDVG